MNPDDFEKKLQQQPMRSVPSEWRNEILDAANAISDPRRSAGDLRPKSWLHQLLWPCPQAWAGLAAVWLVILAVNLTGSEQTPPVAKTTAPSPEMVMALKEHRRELAALVERFDLVPVESPKTVPPRPRSERRIALVIV